MTLPLTAEAIEERVERVRANAEYWLNGGRNERDRDKAVMAVEQSANAWKNMAYAWRDQALAAIALEQEVEKLRIDFTQLRYENDTLKEQKYYLQRKLDEALAQSTEAK